MQHENKIFNISDYVGKGISEEDFQVLMAEGKLFTTIVRLFDWQALDILGPPPKGFPYSLEATHSGVIIAESLDEAIEIAKKRGYGETVDGVLVDIIDWDDADRNVIQNN